MKERKGQYSLGLRDSCLGALGGTGESQVQVKHEPLITASTASLSPTPGASETPWHYVCPP